MRAILRGMAVLLAGELLLAPVPALAQNSTEPAATNTPATDSIGPRELQNFSLPGTTTRPADRPPPATSVNAPPARTDATAEGNAAPASAPGRQARSARQSARLAAPAAAQPAPPTSSSTAASELPLPPAAEAAPAPAPQVSSGPPVIPTLAVPSGTLAPGHKLSLLPWIAAALVLAGGILILLWRRRPREAYAGPQFDLLVAPEAEPEPAPQPAPAPRPAPAPAPPPKRATPTPTGIVASRLRPSLEIEVRPLRCTLNDDQVTIDFEIDLFNAGTAPARAVLAEASLFNAGATQEQELATFFANPVGAGRRVDSIPPMKHLTFTSQVVAPRAAIQEYELAGRKTFVPVIAFNALYEWSGSKGQTSAAYLVGRDTGGEKLGPLRLDLGPREFRDLGAHPLPSMVRT